MEQTPGNKQRQDALLVEYRECQDEATNKGNWLWNSVSLFSAGWIIALGVVATNADEIGRMTWLLAGAAVASQLILLPFVARSLQIGQMLFLRQRQIESQLGMLKSIAINVANNPGLKDEIKKNLTPDSQQELEDFLKEWEKNPSSPIDQWLLKCSEPVRSLLGRPGHAAPYGLPLLVAAAWLSLAIWTEV